MPFVAFLKRFTLILALFASPASRFGALSKVFRLKKDRICSVIEAFCYANGSILLVSQIIEHANQAWEMAGGP
ncbi:MAG: hypothetical protein AB2748_20365 [Candidatus Thiodiazotropha endolucinida]